MSWLSTSKRYEHLEELLRDRDLDEDGTLEREQFVDAMLATSTSTSYILVLAKHIKPEFRSSTPREEV